MGHFFAVFFCLFIYMYIYMRVRCHSLCFAYCVPLMEESVNLLHYFPQDSLGRWAAGADLVRAREVVILLREYSA